MYQCCLTSAVHLEQARKSGKPENVIKNIMSGRMNKFFEEVCLEEQLFVLGETPAQVIFMPVYNNIVVKQ